MVEVSSDADNSTGGRGWWTAGLDDVVWMTRGEQQIVKPIVRATLCSFLNWMKTRSFMAYTRFIVVGDGVANPTINPKTMTPVSSPPIVWKSSAPTLSSPVLPVCDPSVVMEPPAA